MAVFDFRGLRNILDDSPLNQFGSDFAGSTGSTGFSRQARFAFRTWSSITNQKTRERFIDRDLDAANWSDITKYVSPDIDVDALKASTRDVLLNSTQNTRITFDESRDIIRNISPSGRVDLQGLTAAALQETDRIDVQRLSEIEDFTEFRRELSKEVEGIVGRFGVDRIGTAFVGDARFDVGAEDQTLRNLSSDILTLQDLREEPDLGLETFRQDINLAIGVDGFSDNLLELVRGTGETDQQFENRIFRALDERSPFDQITLGSPVRRRGRRSPLGLLSRRRQTQTPGGGITGRFGRQDTLGQPTIFGE